MKIGEKKTGRPASYEKREILTTVSFRADAETMRAIELLTARAAAAGVIAPRSVALRRAIIEAAERDIATPSVTSDRHHSVKPENSKTT